MKDTCPLLKVSDLTVEIRSAVSSTILLNGVDLTVRSGRITALIGESGSGKTMLARSLVSLLPDAAEITGGEIRFQGEVVPREHLSGLRGKNILYIPQNARASLNPVLRIRRQIAEGTSAIKQAIFQVLSDLDFDDPERVFNAYPFELSGGENQRCLLATALLFEARLIIFDEPTASLDSNFQREFVNMMVRLVEKYELSLLLISHNLPLVRAVAHDYYVMHEGRVVDSGDKEDIFSEPTHPYTREIVDLFRTMDRFD